MQDFSTVPLVDDEITTELYTLDGDPDNLEMQLELWQGVKRDLFHDLDSVRNAFREGRMDVAKSQAHKIAGYTGSGGLKRVGVVLRKLQHGEIPEDEFLPALDEIEGWCREGMSEIEGRFPYLCGQ